MGVSGERRGVGKKGRFLHSREDRGKNGRNVRLSFNHNGGAMTRVMTVSMAVGMRRMYHRRKTRAATMAPPTNIESIINAKEVPSCEAFASRADHLPLISIDLRFCATLPVGRLRRISAGHKALLMPLVC